MKKLRTLCLIAPLFALLASAVSVSPETNKTSIVIVKIGDQFDKTIAYIAKNQEMSIEYSCKKSHLVVVEYKHNHLYEADIVAAVLRRLKEVSSSVKVIHAETTDEGISDC